MLESFSKGRTMMIMTEKRLQKLKNRKKMKKEKDDEDFIE